MPRTRLLTIAPARICGGVWWPCSGRSFELNRPPTDDGHPCPFTGISGQVCPADPTAVPQPGGGGGAGNYTIPVYVSWMAGWEHHFLEGNRGLMFGLGCHFAFPPPVHILSETNEQGVVCMHAGSGTVATYTHNQHASLVIPPPSGRPERKCFSLRMVCAARPATGSTWCAVTAPRLATALGRSPNEACWWVCRWKAHRLRNPARCQRHDAHHDRRANVGDGPSVFSKLYLLWLLTQRTCFGRHHLWAQHWMHLVPSFGAIHAHPQGEHMLETVSHAFMYMTTYPRRCPLHITCTPRRQRSKNAKLHGEAACKEPCWNTCRRALSRGG